MTGRFLPPSMPKTISSTWLRTQLMTLVIYYKFVGYLEIPNDLSRPTYSADLREGVSVEYITYEAGEDILDEEA